MRWGLVVAAALAAALFALARGLGPQDGAAAVEPVRPLVDPADSALFDGGPERRVPVAAITLTRPGLDGGEERFFFGRSKGVWRCLSHFGLVASEARLLDLLQGIYLSRTLEHPSDDALDGFGLGPTERVRIELHGADVMKPEAERDVLFTLDVGRALDRGGAFGRPDGRGPALVIDRDLARGLRVDRGVSAPLTGIRTPPLVDPHVIPAAWPPLASGIARVVVEHADGTGLDLERTGGRSDDPAGPSVPLYRLTSPSDPVPTDAHPALTTGYTLFLARTPFERPRDPRELPDRPEVETYVTVFGVEGEPLQLAILPAGFGRTRTVVNSWTGSAYEVAEDVARLLAPRPEQLTDPALGIAWDPYLR